MEVCQLEQTISLTFNSLTTNVQIWGWMDGVGNANISWSFFMRPKPRFSDLVSFLMTACLSVKSALFGASQACLVPLKCCVQLLLQNDSGQSHHYTWCACASCHPQPFHCGSLMDTWLTGTEEMVRLPWSFVTCHLPSFAMFPSSRMWVWHRLATAYDVCCGFIGMVTFLIWRALRYFLV